MHRTWLMWLPEGTNSAVGGGGMLPACNERFQKLRNSSLWIEVNWFLTDSPQVGFCSESSLDWICQLINFLSTLKAAHAILFLTTRYNAYKYKCWGTFNRLVLVFVLNIFIKHKKMEYRNIGSVITKNCKKLVCSDLV